MVVGRTPSLTLLLWHRFDARVKGGIQLFTKKGGPKTSLCDCCYRSGLLLSRSDVIIEFLLAFSQRSAPLHLALNVVEGKSGVETFGISFKGFGVLCRTHVWADPRLRVVILAPEDATQH